MLDLTLMDHNSSFAQLRLNGWMENTLYLVQLVEGMDVIKKVESFGSRSGKTSAKIVVDDCGELSE